MVSRTQDHVTPERPFSADHRTRRRFFGLLAAGVAVAAAPAGDESGDAPMVLSPFEREIIELRRQRQHVAAIHLLSEDFGRDVVLPGYPRQMEV